jgi:hypothetical protein
VSRATCSECRYTFTGDKWFDRHRVNMTGKPSYDPEYDWRCATPDEMRATGWALTAKVLWQGNPGRAHPLVRSQPEAAQSGADG